MEASAPDTRPGARDPDAPCQDQGVHDATLTPREKSCLDRETLRIVAEASARFRCASIELSRGNAVDLIANRPPQRAPYVFSVMEY